MNTIPNLNFTGNVTKTFATSNVTDSSILNKGELATYFQPKENGAEYSYDWSPDMSFGYEFTLSSSKSYTIPVNGWIFINPESYDTNIKWSVSVNGNVVVTSDVSGNISAQFVVKSNDIITTNSSNTKKLTFYACKSEGNDWRPTDYKQEYDIWKGAVVEVGGTLVTRDQYIPNASSWNDDWGDTFYNKIASIDDEEAYDEDGNHLFYIQTYNIENGKNLFKELEVEEGEPVYDFYLGYLSSGFSMGFTIESFAGDCSKLVTASYMFLGSNLKTFLSSLPKASNTNRMFERTKLTEWDIDLPKAWWSEGMFSNCKKLKSFHANVPILTQTHNMFGGCVNLRTFEGNMDDVRSVGYGPSTSMFSKCHSLTSFNCNMPSYEGCEDTYSRCYLFSSCYSLTSCIGDFSSVGNGNGMFNYCTGLADLNADFSNLYRAVDAFRYCRLTARSIASLYNSISSSPSSLSSYAYPYLSLGVGYNNVNDFTTAILSEGFNSYSNLINSFKSKGWYIQDIYCNTKLDRYDKCTTADAVYNTYNYFAANIKLGSWTQSLSSLTTSKFTKSMSNYFVDCPGLFAGYYTASYDRPILSVFATDLPNLIDGAYMFHSSELSIFASTLPKLESGYLMFYNTKLASFDTDMPSLINGERLFAGCYNLISVTSDMPKLTNCKDMFFYCSYLSSMAGDLSSLEDGESMFYNTALASFSGDLSSLTSGYYMFANTPLKSFNEDLPNLTEGEQMFSNCYSLTSFSGDLSSLTSGNEMFKNCRYLTSMASDLSSLTNGYSMFYRCSALEVFSSDMPKLTNGQYMFSNCYKFTTFSGNLSRLTNGNAMFFGTNLTSFSADLPALTNGYEMFLDCTLDAASVERILTTIPTYTDGATHRLSLWFSSSAAAKFAEITGTSPSAAAPCTVSYKGWTIHARINS